MRIENPVLKSARHIIKVQPYINPRGMSHNAERSMCRTTITFPLTIPRCTLSLNKLSFDIYGVGLTHLTVFLLARGTDEESAILPGILETTTTTLKPANYAWPISPRHEKVFGLDISGLCPQLLLLVRARGIIKKVRCTMEAKLGTRSGWECEVGWLLESSCSIE